MYFFSTNNNQSNIRGDQRFHEKKNIWFLTTFFLILLTFHVLLALAASVSQGNAEVVYHIGLSSGRRLEPPCGNFSAPCADFYTALRAHKINANETGLQQVRFKYAAGTYFPAGNRSSVVVDTRVFAPLIIEGGANVVIDLRNDKSCYLVLDGKTNIVIKDLHVRNGRGIGRNSATAYSTYEQKGGSIFIGGTTAVFERVTFSNSTLQGIGFGVQVGYSTSRTRRQRSSLVRSSVVAPGKGAGWIQGGVNFYGLFV